MDGKFVFATFVVLAAFAQLGAAIRCYSCYSISNHYCNDPFKKNSTDVKQYDSPGYVCVKLKGNLENGDGFVTKREGVLEKDFDEQVSSKKYPNAEVVKCNYDLCNPAAQPLPWAPLAILLPIASLTLCFYSRH